jgi:D-arabinose 1-dehydrogenase-like Zn-dependent alcohol dehydrogenase
MGGPSPCIREWIYSGEIAVKAIEVRRNGGPEVLEYSDLASPTPKASEVLVRVAAAGVNFIDVYLREGRYPATCPFVLGQEGCGIVEQVGEGVIDFSVWRPRGLGWSPWLLCRVGLCPREGE